MNNLAQAVNDTDSGYVENDFRIVPHEPAKNCWSQIKAFLTPTIVVLLVGAVSTALAAVIIAIIFGNKEDAACQAAGCSAPKSFMNELFCNWLAQKVNDICCCPEDMGEDAINALSKTLTAIDAYRDALLKNVSIGILTPTAVVLVTYRVYLYAKPCRPAAPLESEEAHQLLDENHPGVQRYGAS